MSKTTTEAIVEAIEASSAVLVCGHVRPDGDSVGSALAMRRLCERLGKHADAVCDADKPSAYAFLPDFELLCAPRKKRYDLFIAVDCANEARLGEYRRYVNDCAYSINIDHHPTNSRFCKLNCVDAEAASTCTLLYRLFAASGLIDAQTATMLYTGLSTDTGHFLHSNTDGESFAIASELCKLGVDCAAVNRGIYCNNSYEKTRLTARALDSIRVYFDGAIALMTITQDDLKACSCTCEDTEGLIDFVSGISGVRIAISACEQQGGIFRVSWRSPDLDVASAAALFGGGGHRLAAGCMINGNRYDVAYKLIEAARPLIGK